jgi:copper chaperone
MKTLKFKTNVNCGGCISTITPHMNQLKGLIKWSVDTSNPLKILTVETPDLDPEDIISTLKEAGYKADLLTSE